jgi:ribonuclease-3
MVPGRRFEVGDTPEGELPPPPAKEIDKGYFERVFGYRFEDIEGLHRALTHRSVHTQGERSDYERLEFLGDAVLDLAMAHLLIDAHPAASEGELSKMRAALVNTTTLAEIAREIQLGTFIRLSRGELASGGAERTSILADVMEAVLGALYREGGFEAALASIKHLFGARVVTVLPRDPKTELQEALHALGKEAPKYLLECTEGPEHAPIFISVVQIDGTLAGRGRGTTKKISQQEAAAEALAALKVGDSKVLAKVEAPIGDTDQPVGTSISDGTQRSDGSAVPDRSGPDRSGPDGSGQE